MVLEHTRGIKHKRRAGRRPAFYNKEIRRVHSGTETKRPSVDMRIALVASAVSLSYFWLSRADMTATGIPISISSVVSAGYEEAHIFSTAKVIRGAITSFISSMSQKYMERMQEL